MECDIIITISLVEMGSVIEHQFTNTFECNEYFRSINTAFLLNFRGGLIKSVQVKSIFFFIDRMVGINEY